MLSGKQLILATRSFAKEDVRRSWFHVLSTLVVLALFSVGTWVADILWIRITSSILCGLTIVRMFVIYHDHQHQSILFRSRAADLLMKGFGILVLAPSSIWKRSHDYHHLHNSKLFSASIGSYPIMTRKRFEAAAPGERRMYLFTRHPLTILFGYIFMFIIGMCWNSFTSSPKKHMDSLAALIIHIAISVSVFVFAGWDYWLLSVFIPHLIASAIGSYLFYAQHNFPGVKFQDKDGWTYEGAALDSSSYMIMSPVMRWFTANIGYHHIHHMNARIPFYRLPEVYAHFPEFQNAKTTSLKPRDIVACFRLKVWDPEKEEMVGLN